MTWPLQPIGPRPNDVPAVSPVDRARAPEQRRERDPDGREHQRREHDDAPEAPQGPDADGHIDVLA